MARFIKRLLKVIVFACLDIKPVFAAFPTTVSSSVIDTMAGVILSPASLARTSTLPSSFDIAIEAVEFPTCIPNTIERDII